MRIRRLFIAICLFAGLSVFVGGCLGQDRVKSEEKKQQKLFRKNKIRKVSEYRTSVLLGIKQNEQLTDIKLYNGEGLLIKQLSYNSSGQADLTKTFTYDANDNLLLLTGVSKDSTLLFKETNTYDKKNNRIEHYHYLSDGTFKYKAIADYDSENKMIELRWYWPTGFRSKNVYAYDGFNKISDTEFSETGSKTYEWQYKYDEKNNLIEAAQYYPANILTTKITYEYNQQSLLIKQTNYQGDSVSGSIVFDYDARNLLITRTEYNPSGKTSAISRYSYE